MPGMDGIEATRRIIAAGGRTRVLRGSKIAGRAPAELTGPLAHPSRGVR